MTRCALFLDRDGVINVDHGYVHRIEDFAFVPGIFELARFAVHELRWLLVVVTNQSGIARGLYDEAAYDVLNAWMCARFVEENAPLAAAYHTPHFGEHPDRKPKPGLILRAAADLDLGLPACALVGDKMSDIEAGRAAGVELLIRLGVPDPSGAAAPPHEVAADLMEVLTILRRRARPSPPQDR